MAWIQRVLAWTQYISSSGLWNNTHDVDRVYICSARLGQRSAWLAPTQRRTGGATSLCGHLTRSCSFGRGRVWLYCHSWSGMCGPCHILCGPTATHCHTLSHIVWAPCCWWLSWGRGMSLVHDTQRCSVQKQIHKAVTNKHTLVSYRTSLNSVWTISKTIWGQWLLREHIVCAPGNWILGPVQKQTPPVSQNRCPSNILFRTSFSSTIHNIELKYLWD